MEEQTVNRLNKKLIACIVAIVLIICGVGGYFYYKRTPTYSLQLIQQAVKDHNWEKFSQHVDTKDLADSAFNDIIDIALEEDKNHRFTNDKNKTFVTGMVQLIKPMVTGVLENAIKEYVETGTVKNKFSSKKDDDNTSTGKSAKSSSKANGNNPANEIIGKTRVDDLKFTGVKDTTTDGSVSTVTIGLHDEAENTDYELKLRMVQRDDGTWKLTKVDNLKEFFHALKEIEKKKLAELNRDLQAQLDESLSLGELKATVEPASGKSTLNKLTVRVPATFNSSNGIQSAQVKLTITAPDGETKDYTFRHNLSNQKTGTRDLLLTKKLTSTPFEKALNHSRGDGYTYSVNVIAIKYADGTTVELLKKLPKN